jgi:prepilin-type N-terminal cleavage/methylation domain-containing protein
MNTTLRSIPRAPRGVTLAEMIIALAVLTSVLLSTLLVMRSMLEQLKFQMLVTDQQNTARVGLDRMMEEIRLVSDNVQDFDTSTGVHTNTLHPTSPQPMDQLTFTVPTWDFTNKVVNMGSDATAITYRWVRNPLEIAGNGRDDDGNGLVDDDDGWIERQDAATGLITRVCNHVPRWGFLVIKQGRRLQIRVARNDKTDVETMDQNVFTTTVTFNTYCLRNY